MHNKVVVFLSAILLCIVVAILAYYLVNKVPERELYHVLKKPIIKGNIGWLRLSCY